MAIWRCGSAATRQLCQLTVAKQLLRAMMTACLLLVSLAASLWLLQLQLPLDVAIHVAAAVVVRLMTYVYISLARRVHVTHQRVANAYELLWHIVVFFFFCVFYALPRHAASATTMR